MRGGKQVQLISLRVLGEPNYANYNVTIERGNPSKKKKFICHEYHIDIASFSLRLRKRKRFQER